MPFLGTTPLQGFVSSVEKQSITNANGILTDFTLTHPVANENDLEVFVGNVRQEPGVGKAYTAAGTTLSMSAAPAAGINFYIIYKNQAQVTTTPPDGSVSLDKLSATGTKDTTTFLRGDNSFQVVNSFNGQNITFEGSTVDDYETILTATDAKLSDKTIKLPSANGTLGMVAIARQAWDNNNTNYLDFTNLPNDYDSFLFDIRALCSANGKDFVAQFIAESNDLIIDGNNYDWTSQRLQCGSAVSSLNNVSGSTVGSGAPYIMIAENTGAFVGGTYGGVGVRAQVIFSGRNVNHSSSLNTMPAINFSAVFGGSNAVGTTTPDGMCQVNGGGRTRPVTNGGGTNTNSFVNVDGIRFYFPTSTIRSVEAACYGLFPSHHS